MRGVNSPLFIGGALIRDPRAVPNLCKADSGLSAMFGILAATEKKSAHDSEVSYSKLSQRNDTY